MCVSGSFTMPNEDKNEFSDPSSFSRPDELIVTNLHLEWDVKFDNKIIEGRVFLDVQRKKTDVECLVSKGFQTSSTKSFHTFPFLLTCSEGLLHSFVVWTELE